jgi:hypothetical protein
MCPVAAGIGFDQVAADARFQRFTNDLVRVVHREHVDFGLFRGLTEAFGGFDPIEFRYGNVDDCDVRLELLRLGNRLRAGERLPSDLPASARFDDVLDPAYLLDGCYKHHTRH